MANPKCVCAIPECNKAVFSRNWCRSHWHRWRTYGSPEKGGTLNGEPLRFLTALSKNPPIGCVEWPFGRTSGGYGAVNCSHTVRTAHRVSLEIYLNCEGIEGRHVAHAPGICHNRLCVNPRHLRFATAVENNADKLIDGTHLQGEKVGNSKLTEAEVLEIRKSVGAQDRVAAVYGISQTLVSQIKLRKVWAHI